MVRWLSATLALAPFGLLACSSAGEPAPSQQAEQTAASQPAPAPRLHTMTVPAPRRPATLGDALADDEPALVAFSLVRQNEEGLAALLRDQQDPSSPRFHAWVTPAEFGEMFGLPAATYDRIVEWLTTAGFTVTRFPNRLYVEAVGSVGAVRSVLGVQLRSATAKGRTFRSHAEEPRVPEELAPFIVRVGGLDTQKHHHRRMNIYWGGTSASDELQVLGADDIRALYDIPTGGASGLTTVVLGTQEGTGKNAKAPIVMPDETAIDKYLTTIAHSTATYTPIKLPNPNSDFDSETANSEYMLDVEMQSVGAQSAAYIDLVLSPSSMVFETGAQYIVNTIGTKAVAVSLSLGMCESEEVGYDGGAAADPGSDAYIMQHAVQQGLAEGQMWFGPAGDTGADDCGNSDSDKSNGYGGGNATVDFPCSLPEMLCVGGTMFAGSGPWFDADGGITGYVEEAVWNEPGTASGQYSYGGGGGGGGQSMLYTKPTWQTGVGPESSDGRRDVPDFSLTAASSTPGVAVYDCSSSGQDKCTQTSSPTGIDIIGGTSVSSPLAAGIFANLAGAAGCMQGDIHKTIYSLAAAQPSGGSGPFHDITQGNNTCVDCNSSTKKNITGFNAGAGYDLASGWGSLDVAKLIAAWPACAAGDGGLSHVDAGKPPLDAGENADSGGGTPDASKGASDSGGTTPTDGARSDTGAGSSSGGTKTPNDGGTKKGGDASAGASSGSSGGCAVSTSSRTSPFAWMAGALAAGIITARRRRRGA